MTKDEALKLALEALEAHADIGIKSDKAITAIREVLAQPEFAKHEVENADDWSEWVCPDPKSYLMKCCDCGLVHEAQFKVVRYKSDAEHEDCDPVDDPNVQAVFRMRRSEQWSPEDRAYRPGGLAQPEQEPSTAYKVWMCPRQDCASSRKCTSFVACSSRAYLEPERSTVKQTLTVKQDDNAHPEYVRGYSAGLEASAISEQKSAQLEPVIDKSAAVRIATSLGWEPKRKPLTNEEIDAILKRGDVAEHDAWNGRWYVLPYQFARAIEAAHDIKE